MAKMKKPTLEEVKEYFKDAKKVQDFKKDKGIVEIDNFEVGINGSVIQNPFKDNWLVLWHDEKGYAKILSYKEPKEKTYKITRDQVKQLKHNAFYENNQLVVADLKNWFPEVFETKLPNCFTGWVLDEKYPKVIAYSENGFLKYGFDANGNWIEGTNTKLLNEREATEQEVEEALTKEAVKRGFKGGVYFKTPENGYSGVCSDSFIYNSEFNILYCGSNAVFNKGQWAEIIPTLTIQEAESKLNCKII